MTFVFYLLACAVMTINTPLIAIITKLTKLIHPEHSQRITLMSDVHVGQACTQEYLQMLGDNLTIWFSLNQRHLTPPQIAGYHEAMVNLALMSEPDFAHQFINNHLGLMCLQNSYIKHYADDHDVVISECGLPHELDDFIYLYNAIIPSSPTDMPHMCRHYQKNCSFFDFTSYSNLFIPLYSGSEAAAEIANLYLIYWPLIQTIFISHLNQLKQILAEKIALTDNQPLTSFLPCANYLSTILILKTKLAHAERALEIISSDFSKLDTTCFRELVAMLNIFTDERIDDYWLRHVCANPSKSHLLIAGAAHMSYLERELVTRGFVYLDPPVKKALFPWPNDIDQLLPENTNESNKLLTKQIVISLLSAICYQTFDTSFLA